MTYLSTVVENSVDATRAAIAPTLQAPPSFGLCFANPGRSGRKREIKSLVHSLPPGAHVVGGEVKTLVGSTPGGDVSVTHSAGFALSLGSFPEATIGSFAVSKSLSTATLLEQLEAQGALSGECKVIIVLASVYGRALVSLLEALQTAHPRAAIVGGLATGRYLVRSHGHCVQTIGRGAVGLTLSGNVPMHALVCRGSSASAMRRHLAHARGQLRRERRELLGGLLFTCTARSERSDAAAFAGVFPTAPLVGMPCNGEIGPGGGARFFRPGDDDDDEEDDGAANGAAANGAEDNGADDDGADGDASGGDGGGASVTQSGDVQVHGFTAVLGLFAVPVRSRAAPLHYSDVDAAYSSSRATDAAVRTAAAVAAAAAMRLVDDKNEDEDDDADADADDDDEDDDDDDDDDDDGEGFWDGEEEQEGSDVWAEQDDDDDEDYVDA